MNTNQIKTTIAVAGAVTDIASAGAENLAETDPANQKAYKTILRGASITKSGLQIGAALTPTPKPKPKPKPTEDATEPSKPKTEWEI